MNDELKATLEWLKECGNNDYIFETGNSRMLLDYITNLQQENQKYKEVIDKAIKLIEKIKERRILRLLEMEVLDILKEVE